MLIEGNSFRNGGDIPILICCMNGTQLLFFRYGRSLLQAEHLIAGNLGKLQFRIAICGSKGNFLLLRQQGFASANDRFLGNDSGMGNRHIFFREGSVRKGIGFAVIDEPFFFQFLNVRNFIVQILLHSQDRSVHSGSDTA